MTEQALASEGSAKQARHRSPNYPAIGLRSAVERIGKIYDSYKRGWAPAPVVHKHLGYKPMSGAAKQVVAALKAYGLAEQQGEGDKAELRISERAYRIVLNHSDRAGLLRSAALDPSLHGELWKKYGDDGLPPDDAIKHYLLFERNFNPESIDGFIAQFKDTVSFAKLDEIDRVPLNDPAAPKALAAGDIVQWESQGVLKFPRPYRIKSTSDDGSYAFFDEFESGIPVAELKLVRDAPSDILSQMMDAVMPPAAANVQVPHPPLNPNFKLPPPSADVREFTLTTDTGDVVLRWPAKLTEEDFEMAETWLEGLKKKMKRSVSVDDAD